MRVGRSQSARRNQRTTSRVLALESLGSRVVLSAAGWGAVDMHMALFDGPALNESAIVHSLDATTRQYGIDASSFGKEVNAAWIGPAGGHTIEMGRTSGSPVELNFNAPRGAMPGYYVAQTLAVSGGIYSVTLVPPPAVIFRFVTEAPSFPGILQLKADAYDAPPRGWPLGQSLESLRLGAGAGDHGAMPQVSVSTPHSEAGPSGDLSGATGRLASFAQTPISQNVGNENRAASNWLSTSSVNAAVSSPVESAPPSKIALAPNRWETSAADLENGLIELESPTLPRGKRVPKLGEELTEDAAASEARRLLEQVWSGWNGAWDAFGELMQPKGGEENGPAKQEIVVTSRDEVAQRMADAEGGMIELAAPAPLSNGVTAGPEQSYLVQSPADDGQKVRMDAGVALYQSFELATAPDAVPPAEGSSESATNAKAADAGSSSGKNAKAKESSPESKNTSAAILGAGLLLSVPMSAMRQRDQEQDDLLSAKSRLKVESIE